MGTPVDNAQKPESHANTCNPHSRGEYPPQTSGGNIVILAAHKQGRGHAAECCPEDGEAEIPGGLDGVGHGREDVEAREAPSGAGTIGLMKSRLLGRKELSNISIPTLASYLQQLMMTRDPIATTLTVIGS
ncbi:hypothetical protein LY78DRAFT_686401 [Colletotrichum sublineola]|nr:hypothetical protein LY78DRAFT_686401 [Colletotrichum sublineola]